MTDIENNKWTYEGSAQSPQVESDPVIYTSDKLKMSTEIHGWLTFFLVILILGGVGSAILPFTTMGNYDNSWLIVADITFGFEALAWTIYIVCLFSARKPNAFFFAISYIILTIISRIVALIAGSSTNSDVVYSIYGFVWSFIVLFYMIFSDQVNEVIPKPFRKVSKRDWGILVTALLIPFALDFVGGFTEAYYDDSDELDRLIEEYRQEQETIMKNTPLSYNERTDGRVIFEIPAGYTCEINDIDVSGTSITLFYIESDYGGNCTMCSDYDPDISVPNFNEYWENWMDIDEQYTSYDEGVEQININGKVFVASFYDVDYLADYVMELLESVRFK